MRWLGITPLILIFTCVLAAWSPTTVKAEPPPATFIVEVADIEKSGELVNTLKARGIAAEIFPKNIRVENAQTNRVIWLGKNVPLEMARVAIREALIFNPHICYVHLVGDRGEKPPERVNNTIHVGGSEEAALAMKLAVIPAADIQKALDQAKTIEELHQFFHDKNAVKK
ncbi:MAG: hypothetical protein NDI77_08660 [Geobacteraceae bacterium]|nr:hypothetical protein [Geobacteraceae bacterium]